MLEPNPKNRWTLQQIQHCWWFKGKAIAQVDVAARMQRRKYDVDQRKYKAMTLGIPKDRKSCGDIFSQKLPYVYFQPPPPLSFVTYKKADWVLEDITNVVAELKGTVQFHDKEKYKLTFHVNKFVDEGKIDKKTRKKQFVKVQVPASVQMWTFPGQQKALDARSRALEAASGDKDNLTEEEIEMMAKNIPKIKSIAVFRSEGGSEAKYLFPNVYSDILSGLSADIICKDVIYNDDLKEESEEICDK